MPFKSLLLALCLVVSIVQAEATKRVALVHKFVSIVEVAKSQALQGDPAVEITLWSSWPFHVGGAANYLLIGKNSFELSGLSSDLKTITFVLSKSQFDSLVDGSPMVVQVGQGNIRSFGNLQKSLLRR